MTEQIEIGEILKSEIAKNRDAEEETEIFQTQMVEENDEQRVEQMHIPGVQYNPPVTSRSFVQRVTKAWKFCVGIYDRVPRLTTLNPGERVSYGSKDGAIVCQLHYKDDGTIQIDTDLDLIANVTGDLTATVTGETSVISTGDINLTTDGNAIITATKVSAGDGSIETLDIIDQLLTLLQGSVDLTGAASTGTNSLILGDLAALQADLGTIKI